MKTLCWRISASRSYSYPWPRPFDVIRFARISKQWARWTLQPFPKVVVPAFAVHWGVVVGPTIYHLVFEDENDADLECNDPCRDGKPIRFTFTKWKRRTEFLEALPVVGLTKFEHIQLCEIGETLVEEFGNYHRLFWNCQVFAKCFLRLITGGHDFDNWTSADATTLFLCGFVVTVPMAKTFKITYKSKRTAREGRMKVFIDQLNNVSPDTEINDALEDMSRTGIGIPRDLAIVAAAEASNNSAAENGRNDTETLSGLKSFWGGVSNVFGRLFR